MSMTLIATDWPVRLSTLHRVSHVLSSGASYRRTLCKPFRNYHHLGNVNIRTRISRTTRLTNAVLLGVEKLWV